MKTKFILGSMVLTAAFAACSNEELATIESADVQSNMIELSENFMIGGIGVESAESRTHWELVDADGKKVLRNFFAPVKATDGANNVFGTTTPPTDVVAPAIGLCWIGQGLGANVYTNYEFIHNGWLAKNADEAIFDACDESKLLTGWTYTELETTAAAGEEVYGTKISAYTAKDNVVAGEDQYTEINYNSGVFKTENKSIFGGQYIAYYPYNKDFIEAGTIPAKSKVEFTVAENNLNSMDIAENTFRYTNVATIAGGAKANGFSFNNLSGVLRISLQNIGGSNAIDVEHVMLYSASAGFLKEVRLSASAIAAEKKGSELYAEVVENSKTILVNAKTSFGIAHSEGTIDTHAIYITALPTTVSDLKVLLYDEGTDKWAEYTIGELIIPAGGSKGITLTVKDEDFKAVAYASNTETLNKALVVAGTKEAPKTVKVLGDIVLTANATIKEFTTVEGDKIIVPAGKVLAVVGGQSILKSDVEVLGEPCCTNAGEFGQLVANNLSTIDGNVYVRKGEGENKLDGRLSAAKATFTANSTITIEGEMQVVNSATIKGAMTVTADGYVVVKQMVSKAAELNFKGATLVNNGTVEVMADGKFNMTAATGNTSTLADGQRFTNNGTFIDNINANVGAATQGMINNGKYICKVASQDRLNIAYSNKGACNIIEFVNDADYTYSFNLAKKHNDAYVSLVVNAATGKNTTFQTTNAAKVEIGNVKANSNLIISESTHIQSGSTYYGEINVKGNIELFGSNLTVNENVHNLKAENLYVNKGATATFKNRNQYTGVTMAVSGTIEVKKDATFTIEAAAANKNIALVTCTSLVEGGTFNGQPELVAAN